MITLKILKTKLDVKKLWFITVGKLMGKNVYLKLLN